MIMLCMNNWNLVGDNHEKIRFTIPVKNISTDEAKKILKELSLQYKEPLIFGDFDKGLEINK
jgi:hypothetical protein